MLKRILAQRHLPLIRTSFRAFHAEGKPPTLEENPVKFYFGVVKSKEKT
jgi:hypothetical protein